MAESTTLCEWTANTDAPDLRKSKNGSPALHSNSPAIDSGAWINGAVNAGLRGPFEKQNPGGALSAGVFNFCLMFAAWLTSSASRRP
jgi:hypothetical protein